MGWLPDLADPTFRPGWREQVRLHWVANVIMLRSWHHTAGFILWSLIALPGWLAWAGFFMLLASLTARGSMTPAAFVGCVALGLIPILAIQHMAFVVAFRRHYAPCFRMAMNRSGTPVCEGCGHLLARVGTACPECGRVA
jgi:hypothetical protein